MKKVLVVTGTRAEYGLLYWTMKAIQKDQDLELQLIVTGSHLSEEYGYTVKKIREDGFKIDEEIDMLIDSNKKSGLAKSMGLELIQMAQAFDRLSPYMLLILGDRYEIFIAAACAMVMNIPIAHMNGGESTEGVIDEQIRHAITKMAHIHFTGAEYYRESIIKMGEEAWRVYNVGQAGIENIRKIQLLGKEELELELGIKLDKKVFLITYHPVTLEIQNVEEQINNLLKAIEKFQAIYIFTYPNADFGSKIIVEKINKYIKSKHDAHVFYNLGQLKYLSLLNYVDVMIGNSSSGIIEAPYFRLPVVNIGDRQKGRLKNKNIIDVGYSQKEIVEGIKTSLDKEYIEQLKNMEYIFGDGTTSKKIVEVIKSIDISKKLMFKKLSY